MLRRTVLLATQIAVLAGLLVTVSLSSVQAATSGAPTTSTNSPVPKGGTIRVYLNKRGSKVVNRSTALFRGTQRVRDMSPAPGRYTARTRIKYQIKTTSWVDVWVPDDDCGVHSYPGYDENGDGDYDDPFEYPPYDACAEGEYGFYDRQSSVSYGSVQKVVRTNRIRVQSDESPGCATFSEYRAIRNGMTERRVKKIVGARGNITYRFLTPNYSHITRQFKVCNGDSWDSMDIEFYKYSPRGTYKAEDKGWYDF